MTSRLDARFSGYQIDAGANQTSFDFSNANIENCFLTAFQAYIRTELNYKNDNLYYVAGNAPPWSGEYNTVVNLETAFAKNPYMKLFVGMGYYDFATPFYPVEWTLAHMHVSDEVKKNNVTPATTSRATWSTSTRRSPRSTTRTWRSSPRARCRSRKAGGLARLGGANSLKGREEDRETGQFCPVTDLRT